jgi:hypothetical protein
MKKFLIVVLTIALMAMVSIGAIASSSEKMAKPSSTNFVLDGKTVTFEAAYDIEGNNYIQLRAVAQMLSGTKSQFNVYWDDEIKQAVIETGKSYTGAGPEKNIEKDVYGIRDTVYMENTEITILRHSGPAPLNKVEVRSLPTWERHFMASRLQFLLKISRDTGILGTLGTL